MWIKHLFSTQLIFVPIHTTCAGFEFVNKFEFFSSNSLRRTFFDQWNLKVFQIKLAPTNTPSVHWKSGALPFTITKASPVCFGAFVWFLNCSSEQAYSQDENIRKLRNSLGGLKRCSRISEYLPEITFSPVPLRFSFSSKILIELKF